MHGFPFRRYIAFKIMILGRQQGGDRPFRPSPTDNAPKIFILKAIIMDGSGVVKNEA